MAVDLIYIDESGYSHNWQKDVDRQRHYVLSATAIDAEKYVEHEKFFFECLAKTGLPDDRRAKIGYGEEIKASELFSGKNFWRLNENLRNEVRNCYLGFPAAIGATSFIVVIDKKRHTEKYMYPRDPYAMATTYLFERLQKYLLDRGRKGVCIYDLPHAKEESIVESVSSLFQKGSEITYFSRYYGQEMSTTNEFHNIVEFAFSRSDYSLGLQIADFFASAAYQHFKNGEPSDCGWWQLLEGALFQVNGVHKGWGLKVFPPH